MLYRTDHIGAGYFEGTEEHLDDGTQTNGSRGQEKDTNLSRSEHDSRQVKETESDDYHQQKSQHTVRLYNNPTKGPDDESISSS